MCTAIVSGVLESLRDTTHPANSISDASKSSKGPPLKIPTRFIACVTRDASAKRVHNALSPLTDSLTIVTRDHAEAIQEADVVLLGCKPYHLTTVLTQNGMREALAGKLLISVLAGVTTAQILETVMKGNQRHSLLPELKPYYIVRAMPNVAALVRQSMTVIAHLDPHIPSHFIDIVTWIFSRVGSVVKLPPHLMDASTALCGSGPATCALVLEAMADGGLAMGIPRAEAQLMAAQTMKGCADMILNGEHPALFREKVSTPGGCTIGGLLVLEEGGVRGSVARSVREATVVASRLGQGQANVNGTRH